MKLFSGSANLPLAEKIASSLSLPLSPRELFIFPDGERRVWIEEEVVGEDCVVIQSTTPPVDESYMELFFIIDGLKRSGAQSVTVVMPYVGYQRQDHIFRSGEAVSIEVVVTILQSLKVDRIFIVDPHTIKIPEMFEIPVKDVSALSLFAKEIQQRGWDQEDSVLVSPDMGGIRRIKIVSQYLSNMPYVTIEKNRDLATGTVEAHKFMGEVRRRCILVDDMISSGKSMVQAANLMLENGAEEVVVFASHPIFSKEAPDILQNSSIKTVFVTDSVFIPEDKTFEKLQVLSLSEMLAQEIKDTIHPVL